MVRSAASNGFVDDLEVNQVRGFEAALLAYMNGTRSDLVTSLREKKTLDKDLTAELQSAVKEFKERFMAQANGAAA